MSGRRAAGQSPTTTSASATDDPQGLRCPFGAHIRRANPRGSLAPNDPSQAEIEKRHRLLRRGRPYGKGQDGEKGMLFVGLCADLERQFEFLQQTWMGSPNFQGLRREPDPISRRRIPWAGNPSLHHPHADGPGHDERPEELRHRESGRLLLHAEPVGNALLAGSARATDRGSDTYATSRPSDSASPGGAAISRPSPPSALLSQDATPHANERRTFTLKDGDTLFAMLDRPKDAEAGTAPRHPDPWRPWIGGQPVHAAHVEVPGRSRPPRAAAQHARRGAIARHMRGPILCRQQPRSRRTADAAAAGPDEARHRRGRLLGGRCHPAEVPGRARLAHADLRGHLRVGPDRSCSAPAKA